MADAPAPAPKPKFKQPWVSQLEVMIRGRENKDEAVDDSVSGGTTAEVINVPTEQGLVTFKVMSDCSCKAINELLKQAALPDTKLSVVSGPRKGLRLGVNGKFDPKLNILVKK